MVHLAYLLPLLPLCGGTVLALFGRRLGEPLAGWLGTATVGGSFVITCLVFAGLLERHGVGARSVTDTLWPWIGVAGLHVPVGLLTDPLSVTMALFVSGISTLIHLYSIGYMHGDEDFPKFFVYLNLFVASMLLLVLADNMLLTFVGWEGVGACSYWLISFWFERDSAASAGKKAFIYNRVGDFGFLLAIFLVFDKTGSLTYSVIFSHLGAFDPASRLAVCLLLFLAAAGKSAQLPLFPWLADAMEGPTPVSALIHAATMVTAGVYLMCRFNPLLSLTHDAQLVVASIGAVTAFVAGTIATTQQDIKKVLAYSTVSQLGYMFLAVGTGAYEAAIFLMLAHAFYKGLLFLGAGSVIHAMDDEQDLKKMGNLRRYLPLTTLTFAVAWLAIAGIPPLSGFWAKGDVLDSAFVQNKALWAIGLVTAAITAYYLTRLVALAFFGDERWRELLHTPAAAGDPEPAGAGHAAGHGPRHGEPHEGPWVMGAPLVVLAVLAFAGGVLSLPWHPSWDPLGWLAPVFRAGLGPHVPGRDEWVLGVVDTLVALVGLGLAFPLWSRQADRPALEPAFLQRGWYLDSGLDAVFSHGGQLLARVTDRFVERDVIDGAVMGVARLTGALGAGLRRVQTGFVRQYALGVVFGVVALLAYVAARVWM
jgi:NADH-quinone oxidoreductase subunit L